MASSELALALPLEAARIVSSLPGRMRVRLAPSPALGQRLLTAVETLTAVPSVSSVTARRPTRSLLIEYDAADADPVWSQLAELGLDTRASTASGGRQVTEPAMRVRCALIRSNEAVGTRAGGHDLRTLVPLGIGLMALRQFVTDDKRLADAPWYVLAWYASETFQKFNHPKEGNHDG